MEVLEAKNFSSFVQLPIVLGMDPTKATNNRWMINDAVVAFACCVWVCVCVCVCLFADEC